MVVRANDIPMSGIIDEKNLKMSRDYEHVGTHGLASETKEALVL